MSDLSLIPRDTSISAATPFVPLNLAYSGLSPAQLFSVAWAYRKLSLAIAVAVLLLAVGAILTWPKTFIADATLMVSYEVNDASNGKDLPVGQVGNYIATQIELMQTPELLHEVVGRLQLTQDEDFRRGHREDRGTLNDWVAAKVAKMLSVYQAQPGSQLIHVVVAARDATLAAAVANAVVDVYKEQDAQRTNSQPGQRAQRYTAQLAELKGRVDAAQGVVTSFQQRHALIDDGNKNNVDLLLLTSLEARWQEALGARRNAEALATADQTVSDQVLGSSQAQALKAQIVVQQQRLAQLKRSFTALHPEVLDAELVLRDLKQTLASTVQTYSDNAGSTLAMARQLEAAAEAAVQQQRTRLLTRGGLLEEATRYRLDLETAQGIYKRAVEAYDQIMFASSSRTTNAVLISRAAPPVKAANSKLLVGLVLGTMLAIGLGLGIPQIYERFHRRVRCRDDLERHQGIPVLAEFNRLSARVGA